MNLMSVCYRAKAVRFTPIELLVMIPSLAALFLPALARGQSKAYQMGCLSKLRRF
jgi:hypothetical protein